MKKVINQIMIGIVVGTFVGMILSLIFSALNGATQYYPSSPAFVSHFNGSLTATAVSVVIWSLIGTIFSLSSMIFSNTDWSIAKMTIIHLLITYFGFLPLAILSGWFPLSSPQIVSFTIIFLVVYFIIYTTMRRIAKREVEAINDQLRKQ
ncbi:hypothetical protein G8J22_00199 [Lentilactobacillus hilgardii]|uniref:DUF3021 domain-containing protein n=2 Tax=Lentilactobacillus hilgardii TaxID=1588 RepID=C0XJ56_LENH9|nr:DUF3021 domain-containing protein [Lentilactobacillus hilgardii]EEI20715.1 hypothetical protein HMPREF0497_0475 [Lentilactobacillus buchneri ATCC 11577]EEI24635.1 hypothetical protein HMPREF0519_1267 [Lentilactobacillus hilgardii DSM 20176 = ATCC 8290]KRK57296.1 conserved hypothetical membrane spanning protein [Lentilactobacillus hilgardii DSM 20176 = ATCC 8290]MCP9334157.1 DUF3021 domain-containing protein [Lentilactobacillus hilgardii]MCP9350775.1 DUF3021 domain-containing protein [Lentil